MDTAIRKAAVLVEALGWIRRFRGKWVVVKLGGSALDEPDAARRVLTDVLFLETVGMKPVLIHGGGKAINRAMNDAGVEPVFIQGRRYTDDRTLDIVARVLAEDICQSLVAEIERQGGGAAALSYLTENVLIGKRLEMAAPDNEVVDLGSVGMVIDIRRDLLEETCRSGKIPVIPSIAVDAESRRLNVNADTAAANVARLLKAEKLVFLSDVPGILADRDDPDSLLTHVEAGRCRELIETNVIDAGMLPKVEAAVEALAAGVGKVHIVDGRMPHSILLEIYSNQGVGTEIVA